MNLNGNCVQTFVKPRWIDHLVNERPSIIAHRGGIETIGGRSIAWIARQTIANSLHPVDPNGCPIVAFELEQERRKLGEIANRERLTEIGSRIFGVDIGPEPDDSRFPAVSK